MSRKGHARVRIYRSFECGQIVAHQYADQPSALGENQCQTGKNANYQFLPHKRYLEPCRFTGLRLCKGFQSPARAV